MHMRGTYFRVYIVLSSDHLKMDKIAKRKPNWSNEEIEVLVQGVTDNIRLIKGKFTPSITNEAKNRCWVEITSQWVHDRLYRLNKTGLNQVVLWRTKMYKKKRFQLYISSATTEANLKISSNAWCFRIIWRAKFGRLNVQLTYMSTTVKLITM